MTQPRERHGLRELLPTLELALAFVAAGLWYSTGGAVWFRANRIGLWPAALLLALWPLHWAYERRRRRVQPVSAGYALCLVFFLLSSGISVWAAYDRQIALAKLGLVLGAAGLSVALAHQPTRRHLYVAMGTFVAGAAALAVFFVLTNDWAAQPAKVPALLRLGQALSAALPTIPGHRITPNVVGGMLAALLPISVALASLRPHAWLGPGWERYARAVQVGWGLLAAVAALALLLTVSRGAWLGLAAATSIWGMWRAIAGPPARDRRLWSRQVAAGGLLCVAAAVAAILAGYALLAFGLPGADALAGRLVLWRSGLIFAQDYAYTGVGLGLFPIPFAVYTLLIHVGYIVYSHNMWIDVLAEQGMLGLAALGLLTAVALGEFARWRRVATSGLGRVLEACLVAWLAIAVHGLVDNTLYGSRGVLLLFVPCGMLVAAAGLAANEYASRRRAPTPTRSPAWVPVAGILSLTLLWLGLTAFRPTTAWYANLGAVAQTKAELEVYDPLFFDRLDLDEVRRQVDLAEAIRFLEQAVGQPAHPTARRRLTSIALARGQYEQALALMQVAWEAGHRDAPTRLLYGDALVANGYVEEATQVVRGLPWAVARLEGQAWTRYWARGDYERAAYAYEAVAILAPGHGGAAERAAEARRRAGLAPRAP